MMGWKNKACGNCAYYFAEGEMGMHYPTDGSDGPPGDGQCRRIPPQVFYDEELRTLESAFPAVIGSEDVCGEWRPILI